VVRRRPDLRRSVAADVCPTRIATAQHRYDLRNSTGVALDRAAAVPTAARPGIVAGAPRRWRNRGALRQLVPSASGRRAGPPEGLPSPLVGAGSGPRQQSSRRRRSLEFPQFATFCRPNSCLPKRQRFRIGTICG
jgi:hypothetical protein